MLRAPPEGPLWPPPSFTPPQQATYFAGARPCAHPSAKTARGPGRAARQGCRARMPAAKRTALGFRVQGKPSRPRAGAPVLGRREAAAAGRGARVAAAPQRRAPPELRAQPLRVRVLGLMHAGQTCDMGRVTDV